MSSSEDPGEETKSVIQGWEVVHRTHQKILSSSREEAICTELGVTNLPDQFFEHCTVHLKCRGPGTEEEGEGIFDLRIDALGAIRCARVSKEDASHDLRCMYYETWKKKNVELFHTGLHWTYDVQDYVGTVSGQHVREVEGGEIDMALLQDTTQPILHYAAMDLFEDDLDDCGTSKLYLKFRCMPTCWFLLLRQFIRVDRVQLKIRDVRWFHKFGVRKVVRHSMVREKEIADMADAAAAAAHTDDSTPLKLYNDPDTLANTLPIRSEKVVTYEY